MTKENSTLVESLENSTLHTDHQKNDHQTNVLEAVDNSAAETKPLVIWGKDSTWY